MADDARELVAEAEREAESGNHENALKAVERAYVPVQKARELELTDRALAVTRRLADEPALGGRERRKARGIVSWYELLVRGHAQSAAQAARASAARPFPPSLAWIDGLVVVLGLFVGLDLIGGGLVAIAADATNERISAIAGAIFAATMMLALIAIIRLLQAIERNHRSSEPGDEGGTHPA
jgi:hypothetical protein